MKCRISITIRAFRSFAVFPYLLLHFKTNYSITFPSLSSTFPSLSSHFHFSLSLLSLITESKLRVSDLIPLDCLAAIKRLTSYCIPLSAVFSIVCERTWRKILSLGENIPQKKYVWGAIQKAIVEDTKFELVTVLKKENYRCFLVTFLQQSPPESACLQCWLQVKNILEALETFKYPSFNDQVRNNICDNRDTINQIIECGGKLSESGNYSQSRSFSGALSNKNPIDSAAELAKRRTSWRRPLFAPFSTTTTAAPHTAGLSGLNHVHTVTGNGIVNSMNNINIMTSSNSMINNTYPNSIHMNHLSMKDVTMNHVNNINNINNINTISNYSINSGITVGSMNNAYSTNPQLASNATMQSDLGMDYSDPMGAFALLLVETRKLHRRYVQYVRTYVPGRRQAPLQKAVRTV